MPEQVPARTAADEIAARIDTTVPHPARRYDYMLGGKDNFAADRESAEAALAVHPALRVGVLENRRFLGRAVTYLAREAGIRQFLDVGTGIPSVNNTHQVAQSVAPESRIVYVDNDPIVLSHARALLTSAPQGRTAYLDADLREPDKILGHPDLRATLDLDRPVAVVLMAILHFIPDADDPYGIVARLLRDLPAGSFLCLSHFTMDFLPEETADRLREAWESNPANGPGQARTLDEVGRFFDGLDLVPPGIVSLAEWRADDEPQPRPSRVDISGYGAVGRKG